MSHSGDDWGEGRQRTALFVERKAYRRRRLMDIARLLPLFGALLFLVPLMWPNPDPYPAPDTSGGKPISEAITYLFTIWTLLIVASFVFGVAVRRWAENWTEGTDKPGEEAP
ncbi:hypothetical protein FEE96_16220 [Parasedimentitalea maritima]|uniref:Uncharacterized protein n=1 Tax=Parasedimentitalea maritima TaxID=2578117 RepID=A0A5R8Z3U5_9RHOB|nr:hypothetical protein [Zongyanglinia marina]KAE9631488.1 hypothetical protein GP644_03990 [Zongyanglinia marina]TLP60403.1 hypothetical protein FEE96_16220 [Zongyanglinia marina]